MPEGAGRVRLPSQALPNRPEMGTGTMEKSMQTNMNYSVNIKRNPFEGHDYTFVEAYFQGCDKHYMTKQEAEEYLASFEDWEQEMLVIEEFPF
jgi:hypothetical protein